MAAMVRVSAVRGVCRPNFFCLKSGKKVFWVDLEGAATLPEPFSPFPSPPRSSTACPLLTSSSNAAGESPKDLVNPELVRQTN